MTFNLSARDVTSPDSILSIMKVIGDSGVAPGRIDLEVTEAALMSDFNQSGQSLRMLKALGVGISLDDFGKGYSSLSSVHRLPIDRIKVGQGSRGPITKALQEEFFSILSGAKADKHNWLTPVSVPLSAGTR